jgi:hypothetical protein
MENHIREGELLRAADGELSKERAAQINEHLAACWMCRTRLHDLEATIDQFVHAHINEFKPRIPEMDGPRALLRARIEVLEQAKKRSFWEAFSLPLYRWGVPLYSAVAVIIVAALLFPLVKSRNTAPRLTAGEILNRAESGEQIGLRQARQPVTYQKVRIQVGANSYHRTIYRETASARHVARVESIAGRMSERDVARVLDPVERAFSEARLDWQAPLSPLRWSGWRSALRVSSEQVLREQATTVLSTNTPEGPIAEARVIFRNTDFHPISETLRLRDNSVVEIAELDYRVVELSELEADVFDRPTLPVVPVAIPKTPAPLPEIVGSLELELDVIERLDHAKAFLGEQISVRRNHDAVAVRGVVDGQQRKEELITALGSTLSSPALKVELVVPGAAAHTAHRSSGGVSVEGVEDLQKAPADEKLRAFFGRNSGDDATTNEAVQHFAAEVSMHSQSARAHALALKQIAEQFSSQELNEMAPQQRRQWRTLLEEHSRAVLVETRMMRENLEPIFRSNAEDKQPLVTNLKSDADIVYAATRLSELAATNDSDVWRSFAASTQASNTTLVCLPEFWDSLLDTEVLAQEILVSITDGR